MRFLIAIALCSPARADEQRHLSSDDFTRGASIVPYTLPWWHPEIQAVATGRASLRTPSDISTPPCLAHSCFFFFRFRRLLPPVIILVWTTTPTFSGSFEPTRAKVIVFLMAGMCVQWTMDRICNVVALF